MHFFLSGKSGGDRSRHGIRVAYQKCSIGFILCKKILAQIFHFFYSTAKRPRFSGKSSACKRPVRRKISGDFALEKFARKFLSKTFIRGICVHPGPLLTKHLRENVFFNRSIRDKIESVRVNHGGFSVFFLRSATIPILRK